MASVEHFSEPFPWRTATLVASSVAAVELVGLVVVGALVLAHPFGHTVKRTVTTGTASAPVVHHAAKPVVHRHVVAIPAKDRFAPVLRPLRPRGAVHVLVLNANGVQGAAHAEAAHLQSLGYSIGGVANAPTHRYSQSMVMYVPGYGKEARRLAHDAGIRMVAPVDGLTTSTLSGSRLVVLLGS